MSGQGLTVVRKHSSKKITFTVNLLKLNCWIKVTILASVSYYKFYQLESLETTRATPRPTYKLIFLLAILAIINNYSLKSR